MNPEALSRELRLGSGGFLPHRRRAVALSLLAAGAMTPIALYQTGLIRHLPEPPLPWLNSDAVDAAGEAYAILDGPVAADGYAWWEFSTAGYGPDGATPGWVVEAYIVEV